MSNVPGIVEMQKRNRRLQQRLPTIEAELLALHASELAKEAAEIIGWLKQRLEQAQKDLRDEQIGAQRDARDAYEDGVYAQSQRERW